MLDGLNFGQNWSSIFNEICLVYFSNIFDLRSWLLKKKKKQPNDIYKAKEENMLIELANDSKFKRISDIKNSREILQRHVN